MKKLVFLLALVSGVSAQASMLDNKLDFTEVAEAVANCSKGRTELFKEADYEFVKSVTADKLTSGTIRTGGQSRKFTTKTYYINTAVAMGFMGVADASTLTATVTITQPPHGAADMPSSVKWNCSLTKLR
jgi:hypothetical protein